MKIGFFDSGLGGLTVLRAVHDFLPKYDYIYFGDTANLPYGDKTEEEIRTLTRKAIEYLFNAGALLVIVACNTASAEALRVLQDTMLEGEYKDRRLLGVIIPTIETLIEEQAKKVLLIATVRTIESMKYAKELEKISSKIHLDNKAIPVLVPYIETGAIESAFRKVEETIQEKIGEIDTVVLGCTHYSVLKERLRETFPNLKIISQDEIIPQKLKEYLDRHKEIENRLTQNGTVRIVESNRRGEMSEFKKDLLSSLGNS
jgi:glutamate racemase